MPTVAGRNDLMPDMDTFKDDLKKAGIDYQNAQGQYADYGRFLAQERALITNFRRCFSRLSAASQRTALNSRRHSLLSSFSPANVKENGSHKSRGVIQDSMNSHFNQTQGRAGRSSDGLPAARSPSEGSQLSDFVAKLHAARFLSASLIVHLFLGILLGGLVLFKSVQQPGIFVGSTEGFIDSLETEQEPQELEELTEPVEFPDAAPKPEAESALSASAISTLSSSATMTQTTVPLQTFGTVISQTRTQSGFGAATGSAAGKNKGGKMKMTTVFGSEEDTGSGLVGYFYDIKQTTGKAETNATIPMYRELIGKLAKTWDTSLLSNYYRARQPLYTAQVLIPIMPADEAPKAFGVEKEVQPRQWFVHYHGVVCSPESGVFRLVGNADDILIVAINNEVVLDGCRSLLVEGMPTINPKLKLSKDKEVTVDIILGEEPGGGFGAYLAIQKDNEENEPARPVQFADAALPDMSSFPVRLSDRPFIFTVHRTIQRRNGLY